MGATSLIEEQKTEMLRRIDSVARLQDQLERAVHRFAEGPGDPCEVVDSARALEEAVRELKRETARQYLESRILEAVDAMEAVSQ